MTSMYTIEVSESGALMTCAACEEMQVIRGQVSRSYVAADNARRALRERIEMALKMPMSPQVRDQLELALTEHGAALLWMK